MNKNEILWKRASNNKIRQEKKFGRKWVKRINITSFSIKTRALTRTRTGSVNRYQPLLTVS